MKKQILHERGSAFSLRCAARDECASWEMESEDRSLESEEESGNKSYQLSAISCQLSELRSIFCVFSAEKIVISSGCTRVR